MTQNVDLFGDVRERLQCQYLSDLRLPLYADAAGALWKHMDLRRYPLRQLSDMAQYVYGRPGPFCDMEEAVCFFAAQK